MSRTIRRKTMKDRECYGCVVYSSNRYECLRVINGILHSYSYFLHGFYPVCPSGRGLSIEKFLKREDRLFHSDKGVYAPPAWYRRMANQGFRRRGKAVFETLRDKEDGDELLFEPHKQTIRYSWW